MINTAAIRLAAVMQPYTPDAIHRATFDQLLEILVEMLHEMSEYECDAMLYRFLRCNLYVEDSCLEIAMNIPCHTSPSDLDIDQAIVTAMVSE